MYACGQALALARIRLRVANLSNRLKVTKVGLRQLDQGSLVSCYVRYQTVEYYYKWNWLSAQTSYLDGVLKGHSMSA